MCFYCSNRRVLGKVLKMGVHIRKLGVHVKTSAVLRLECSLDCISGSVGHQQNIFRSFFVLSAFLLKKKM